MNNLKTIAKLATLVVIGGGTIGAAVGITQAQSFHDAPLSAEAAGTKEIFFEPTATWDYDEAKFALYGFGPADQSNIWIPMNEYHNRFLDKGNRIFSCEVDTSKWNKLIFARMNSEFNTVGAWDMVWNQTIDLTFNGNYFRITGNNQDNKFVGDWSNFVEPVNPNFQPIWLEKPINVHWTEKNVDTAIGYWGNGHAYTKVGPKAIYNEKYYYYEVPYNVEGIKFCRCENGSNYQNEWGGGTADILSINNYCIYEISETSNWVFAANESTAADKSVTADMLQRVLSYVETCTDNEKFGYKAYPQIRDNFEAKLVEEADLDHTFVTDYNHEEYLNSNNKDYDVTSKQTNYSLRQKLTSLKNAYESNGTHGLSNLDTVEMNNTALIAGSVTILATSLIAGFAYLLKKRKANA